MLSSNKTQSVTMLLNAPPLSLGSPRFSDPLTALLATKDGYVAAWQSLLREGIEGAIDKVTGDFAVALQLNRQSIDQREKICTFLAVDRFGIQTLCYRIVDGCLRYASRADDLADSKPEIDPQAIYDYLYFHSIPSPRTIYKDVFRLPPGHFARFEDGQLTVSPYWIPHFSEPREASFAGLKDEFRSLLRESVSNQLDESKAACFLSGGTDSSTVAGMASLISSAPVASYSIGFDAQGYDEMEYARLAAKHFDTEHHEYYITPDDLVQSIPKVAAYFDQPFGNSSALPSYYCAKMAKEDGVRKILAGDGGDELFGGNSRYAKQRVFSLYGHVPRGIQKAVIEPLLVSGKESSIPIFRKARSYVEQASIPMPDRLQMYNLITRMGVSEVLTPEILSKVDLVSPLRHQRVVWNAPQECSHLNRELAFDWRYTLAESDLPKVLGAAGCANLQVGFPMLDDKLLRFSQGLPVSYKLNGLKLRWFFKEALRGFLPNEILVKKKQGFGLPFGVWASKHGPLNALASASLDSLANRGVVRKDFVHTLMSARLLEHPGYYGEMVWILMMLEQWLNAKAPEFKVGVET